MAQALLMDGLVASGSLSSTARQANRLRGGAIPLDCPVRLLHGQADEDVPWQVSLRLAEALAGADVRVTLVKDGDHRLSRDADIALLIAQVAEIA